MSVDSVQIHAERPDGHDTWGCRIIVGTAVNQYRDCHAATVMEALDAGRRELERWAWSRMNTR